ncbi:MAG: hypothetical protein O2968_20275 [Acidobacteria bacterium]|nr:hypothetical protein [Acidobacteriota bacterium]
MSRQRIDSGRVIVLAAMAALLAGSSAPLDAAEKMKPEELVAKHLEAIGPADVRASMKTRYFVGQGTWRVLIGGRAQMPGDVFQASEGDSVSFRFDTGTNPTYYGEHLVYNGDDVHILQGFQGGRSPLGEFFTANKGLLREGLFGGVTSTAWPLPQVAARKAKLKYAGLKKVEGRELHRLDYKPNKGSGSVNIQLFFDPENYQHVQTTYRYKIPGRMGASPDESAGQQPTYVNVTETFSNFQEIDGLTLPVKWKVAYDRTNQGDGPGSMVAEWEIGFTSAVHNKPIDPALYELGAKAE